MARPATIEEIRASTTKTQKVNLKTFMLPYQIPTTNREDAINDALEVLLEMSNNSSYADLCTNQLDKETMLASFFKKKKQSFKQKDEKCVEGKESKSVNFPTLANASPVPVSLPLFGGRVTVE
jgi:hypothetical protein